MIETERLRLRPWRDRDREPFAALGRDPLVMEHLGEPMSRQESDAGVDRMMACQAEHGVCFWAAERKADQAFLGFIGVKPVTFAAPFAPNWKLGWRLGSGFWGQGYATEGAATARDYTFEILEADEVIAITVPANAASQAVMRKIGLVRDLDGDFDHPNLPEGHHLRRHVLYRQGRGDWAAGRSGKR